MKYIKPLLSLCASLFALPGLSQTELRVATGECTSKSCGTYVQMFRELRNQCSSDLVLTEVQSKGSVESVDRLLNNDINAAIAQTDVLFWRKRTEDLANIKTLVALHPEEVHFVATADSGQKSGGYGVGKFQFGQSSVVFTQVDHLAGYKVGAVDGSGSLVTARLIRAEGNVMYEVVPLRDTPTLLAALKAGTVQAAVFVGGANLAAVSELDASFKLLPFSDALRGALKDIYKPVTLNYPNVGATGVKSVATQANLVTREYKTPKMVAALAAFRSCALGSAIDTLKETTGTHRKWQAVDAADRGKWSWYELPQASTSKKK